MSDLVERLVDSAFGISTPMMEGDNLAVLLCSNFENVDQGVDDETNWTPDAITGYEQVRAALHEHFKPAAARIAELERIERLHKEDYAKLQSWIAGGQADKARIATLEAELLEQARIVGAGGERELALLAKVDALEAEVADTKTLLLGIGALLEANVRSKSRDDQAEQRMILLIRAALGDNHD